MTRHSLRKLAPDNQLEKVKLLRTLIDALPNCICVKDLEGHYLFNNLEALSNHVEYMNELEQNRDNLQITWSRLSQTRWTR